MTSGPIGTVLINGTPVDPSEAAVSVFDIGFQRGYGCFEAMRSYGGVPFRLQRHLARLVRSAEMLRIPLDPVPLVEAWCREVCGTADGVLRLYVTGGVDMHHPGTDNATVVFLEPLPSVPEVFSLDVVEAPWHVESHSSELAGAKTLSYGPNLAATIAARSRGFDDALLVGTDDVVLEGPTFSLGWVRNETIHTPGLDTGILASVTREAALEVATTAGIGVAEGSFGIDEVLGADEVFVMSTVREVGAVVRVGSATFEVGPVTRRLRAGFRDLVRSETS